MFSPSRPNNARLPGELALGGRNGRSVPPPPARSQGATCPQPAGMGSWACGKTGNFQAQSPSSRPCCGTRGRDKALNASHKLLGCKLCSSAQLGPQDCQPLLGLNQAGGAWGVMHASSKIQATVTLTVPLFISPAPISGATCGDISGGCSLGAPSVGGKGDGKVRH